MAGSKRNSEATTHHPAMAKLCGYRSHCAECIAPSFVAESCELAVFWGLEIKCKKKFFVFIFWGIFGEFY
jgi:hypothetical protein